MPPDRPPSRAVVIQLARLGDLIQTLPLLEALRGWSSATAVDLLCAAPLAALVQACFPVNRTVPWDGARCRQWAEGWDQDPLEVTRELEGYLDTLASDRYDVAYNLNQHARAVLAAHVLAHRVTGAGATGPIAADSSPWTTYLRRIARDRGHNRIHLADAFCGLCGLKPTGRPLRLRAAATDLPADLETFGAGDHDSVALVVGAGDRERCVPPSVWTAWIDCFLTAHPRGRVVLVGSGGEREAAQAVQAALPSMLLGRVWDAVGRTDLMQLTGLLSRCQWVLGADTGPLHLGTAVGARAMGWYFARARVHETGPYGAGHWVLQHQGQTTPADWPIQAAVDLMLTGCGTADSSWEVWASRLDAWGACFVKPGDQGPLLSARESVWKDLSPDLVEVDAA